MSGPIHPFWQQYSDLPDSLPIFPLTNAVILPFGELPLNIFEPRYLNMVQDAMKTHQLIGMIQPLETESNSDKPTLYQIGCAGRIICYEETDQGQLKIMLRGISRFQIIEELDTTRGYRKVVPDWCEFKHDFEQSLTDDSQQSLLLHGALRNYFSANNIQVDWDSLTKLNSLQLMANLVSFLSLKPQDKQLLIETREQHAQLQAFTAMIEGNQKPSNTQH